MNVSVTLAKAVKKGVYSKQKGIAKDLVGKNVIRNGTTFLVVSVSQDKIIVSATGTEIEQTNTFILKSFLSKKITVIEDEKV
jgi:hypothetical protein